VSTCFVGLKLRGQFVAELSHRCQTQHWHSATREPVVYSRWMSKMPDIWPFYQRLFGYVKPYRLRLAGGILLATAYSASNGATLLVVKMVWAKVFEQANQQNLTWLQALAYAGLVPFIMAVRGVCDFGTTYLMNWVGGKVVNDLRVLLFEHLQSLSLDYFTGAQTGELISRSTNDVGAIQNSISTVVADIVKQPGTLIFVLAALFRF